LIASNWISPESDITCLNSLTYILLEGIERDVISLHEITVLFSTFKDLNVGSSVWITVIRNFINFDSLYSIQKGKFTLLCDFRYYFLLKSIRPSRLLIYLFLSTRSFNLPISFSWCLSTPQFTNLRTSQIWSQITSLARDAFHRCLSGKYSKVLWNLFVK